jgi:hypothetical protein
VFETIGWAVHEKRGMPAVLVVQVGTSSTVVTAFDCLARLQVQSRLYLPYAMYDFRIHLSEPAGVMRLTG